ncbi:hypothetical protein Bca101_056279 [Brassica carinata]
MFHTKQLNQRLARCDEINITLKINEARRIDRDDKTISCSRRQNHLMLEIDKPDISFRDDYNQTTFRLDPLTDREFLGTFLEDDHPVSP